MAVTDRATELKMTLYDYEELKLITQKLIQVHADPQNELFKQSADYIQSKVTAYPAFLLFVWSNSVQWFITFTIEDIFLSMIKGRCSCPNTMLPCRYFAQFSFLDKTLSNHNHFIDFERISKNSFGKI